MRIAQSFRMQTPFFARSSMRPGVPTSKCTGWYKRIMSSFKLVPPVVTITWIFKYFPSSLQTCDVWSANSRVGTNITTEHHKVFNKQVHKIYEGKQSFAVTNYSNWTSIINFSTSQKKWNNRNMYNQTWEVPMIIADMMYLPK